MVEVGPEWHVFSTTQPDGGPIRTTIDLEGSSGVSVAGPFVPDQAPTIEHSPYFPVPLEEHFGRVLWRGPVTFPEEANLESLQIKGRVNGQMCREGACVPLDSLNSEFVASFAGWLADAPLAPGVESSSVATGAPAAISLAELWPHLWLGFLGGLLLNLMPCVLPVIGLKIMSFVQQSHGLRGEAFRLNAIYALGVVAVFLTLATLSVWMNLSWGEQFTFTGFKIGMIVLVFAMALSFLGVWEIPIPGFVGTGKAGELAAREGASGAFFKGVFATILATPCSGPLMGPMFAFSLGKPAYITYAIFTSMGLGMAAPYVLIGMFPQLVRWIPKPGAWMDTFKQLMGFVLLFTVVFLFYTLGNNGLFVPTLALLVGVWFACWLIGRVPITAGPSPRFRAWVVGVGLAALVGCGAFRFLGSHNSHVEWRPYSESELLAAQRQGKTVLVDVSANWCLTCKLNLAVALNTKNVGELIREHDVVPMLADWTDRSSPMGRHIKSYLKSLGHNSIPLLVIYPAASPMQPMVLPDLLTEARVIEALRTAGPSQSVASRRTVRTQ
ncbi:MAG TPA: cytochrome c biogenesis protein CcdA [Pirellulaceae bacterium]